MNKYFLISILALFYSLSAGAWTLTTEARSGFPTSDITIKISGNACVNAGFTAATLEALVNDAINDYWSKVPTSALNLSPTGIDSSIDVSSDTLTNAAAKTSANTIIVGCGQNAASFPDGSILGVGGLGCGNGVCRGAVLLNDTATTQLDTLDRNTILTTFAHELGHALGLGHSSVQPSLMYYSLTNKTQKSLSQDDIDGISYLYPTEKKLGGLAGACGTIDTNPSGPNNFLGSLLLGFLIVLLARFLLSKQKASFQIKL